MSRQGRRNKTRWIKLMKRRGYVYRRGHLWRKFTWKLALPSSFFQRGEP